MVEGPCLALWPFAGSCCPLTLIHTIAVLLAFVPWSCLFLLWSLGARAAAERLLLLEFFHWKKGARCWCYEDNSEPWLITVALKKWLKCAAFSLCGLWDKYWFLFVLSLFVPGSRLKLFSGKKAWVYWRSSCFKLKVFLCSWSHNKPIFCFLITLPVEDLRTLPWHQMTSSSSTKPLT